MFKVPHKDRITYGPMGSGDWAGNNGAFQINLSNRTDAMVVASNGEGWEHVSVRMIDRSTGKDRTPTWSEMCKIKDIFWAGKKDEKKLLLRLPKKAYEAVKRSAEVNKRSINSELEYSIEEKYL
jgi:predicted HicB family RNase H-like nuclease